MQTYYLSSHQPGSAAAGARVILNTSFSQAGLALLPQSLHGFITHALLLSQLLLHLLSLLQSILFDGTAQERKKSNLLEGPQKIFRQSNLKMYHVCHFIRSQVHFTIRFNSLTLVKKCNGCHEVTINYLYQYLLIYLKINILYK